MKENILIIQTAFIGDAILTLPMIKILKEKYQDSQIDIIAIPSTEEIFNASPYIDNVIILKKRNEHKSFFGLIKFGKKLRENNYTKIYSAHRSFRSAILTIIINCKETYGFSNSVFPFAYKNVVEYEYSKHEVARNLKLAGFNIENDNWKIKPEIDFDKLNILNVNKLLAEYSQVKIIAVAPGSIWNTKKYPLEYFYKIIEHFIEKNYTVFIFGSEKDKNDADFLAKINPEKVVSLAGKFSLLESTLILRKVELLICNDSAPTHLGMIADAKVLTLFCSTVPEFGFYPYNKKSAFLSYDKLNCKPCGIHGFHVCPQEHFNCGTELNYQMVIKKAEEMIND